MITGYAPGMPEWVLGFLCYSEGSGVLTKDGSRHGKGWTEVSASLEEFIAFVSVGSDTLAQF